MLNAINWLIRWRPLPDTEAGKLAPGDVKASVMGSLIAFAVAWPTIEMSLKAVLPALPEPIRPKATLLISTVAAAVAFGTQLYRMWVQDATPGPPKPTEPTK